VNYAAGAHFQRGYDKWEFHAPNIPQYQSGLKVPAEFTFNSAADILRTHKKENSTQPFFCFVHFWDPHSTYLPPEQYQKFYDKDPEEAFNPDNDSLNFLLHRQPRNFFFSLGYGLYRWGLRDKNYITSLYDGEINYADDYIGRLLHLLEQLEMDKETLIILTADHGEVLTEDLNFAFGQQFYYAHLGLTDPNIHIPLIIANPEILPYSKVCNQFVEQIDVTPTILDLLQINQEEVGVNYAFDGISLNPVIRGDTDYTRDWVYFLENSYQKRRGLRGMRWKYVENLESELKFPCRSWLYDLVEDPLEEFNLIDHLPEIANSLKIKLNEWVEKYCAKFGKEDPQKYIDMPLGENQKRKIRSFYESEIQKFKSKKEE
jgi:arylsulfatase A-like enzyme